MAELARGGFNPQEINAATKSVLSLARASDTEAATAAEILIATINPVWDGGKRFSASGRRARRWPRTLAVSVESLGESLQYAGPVASQLGLSLEDTIALLSQLGNFGIKGSESGTALRRISILAATSGEELKGMFNVDNIDAAGNFKPLVQIMDEIGASIRNMPRAEAVGKLEEAFGILGITAANVLGSTDTETRNLAMNCMPPVDLPPKQPRNGCRGGWCWTSFRIGARGRGEHGRQSIQRHRDRDW